MMTYLDNAATTFQKPESVYRAMDDANRNFSVNAGRGSYALAQKASEAIEETRRLLVEITEADKGAEVVFTASATLAFNAIIGGISWKKEDIVYVSSYEHNAVIRTLWGYQKKYGFQVREIPLANDYAIDLTKLVYLFAKEPPNYLFLNMVSNVTGYILPVQEICREAKKYSCVAVLDGAQALGTLPVDLKKCNADLVIFAGHKALCGPFGIGGYINITGMLLERLFYGGTGTDSLNPDMPSGESGFEPGSPNIAAIMGLRAALLEIRQKERQLEFWKRENSLICNLKEGLRKIPGVFVYAAPEEERQAGIVSINLEGYSAQEIGSILDESFEIAVRTGYHCAPLIHQYLDTKQFSGTVRISIGRFTKEDDLEKLKDALEELAE